MKTNGWCPVHDRVYEAKDGLCPECGTPLVPVATPKTDAGPILTEADVEPEALGLAETAVGSTESVDPIWTSNRALGTIAVSIIVLAFLSGLALARVTRSRTPAPDRTPLAAADIAVGSTRVGGGIGLRLDSFTQRGATVVLRVTVAKDAPIEVGLIQGATVAFSSAHEELARVQLPTRATTSGFIADGGIPDIATKPITEVRIANLTVGLVGSSGSGSSGGITRLDLSGVWPVKAGSAPRVKHLGTSVKLDDGRAVRLDSVVGWPDRLEARLEVKGQRFNWDYNEVYALVFPGLAQVGGTVQPAGTSSIVRYVDFFGVDPTAKEAGLQINVSDVTITGDWDWNLTP